LGGRGRWISEFEASLVYKVSSRTARATQRNPVSKTKQKQKTKKQKKLLTMFIVATFFIILVYVFFSSIYLIFKVPLS
jgi:cell division protein FtsL